jgi:hypothetical protein
MMDMLERMLGKSPGQGQGQGQQPQQQEGSGKQPGQGESKGEGSNPGKGSTGYSDTGNETVGGETGGKSEERRVPKAAGSGGLEIPEEFRQAFDAYNRGLEAASGPTRIRP